MDTRTGDIVDVAEMQRRIRALATPAERKAEKKHWRKLLKKEHKELARMSPAERIAWAVREKLAKAEENP